MKVDTGRAIDTFNLRRTHNNIARERSAATSAANMIYRVSQSIQDQELEECNKKRTGQSQRVVKGATNGSRRLPCIDGPEEQTWHSHGARGCFVRLAILGQRRPHESSRARRNENYWIAAEHQVARRISSQRVRSGDILVELYGGASLQPGYRARCRGGLTRLMKSLLFGISSLGPVTYLAVSLILGMAAIVASYLPARHAAAVDPVQALKMG